MRCGIKTRGMNEIMPEWARTEVASVATVRVLNVRQVLPWRS